MAEGKPQADPVSGEDTSETEKYQIYVRVPTHGKELEADQVHSFLEKIAMLLSDEHKDVTVEPDEPDDGEDHATYAKSAGGHASPLYPLYVCHNKF